MSKLKKLYLSILFVLCLLLVACDGLATVQNSAGKTYSLDSIPDFSSQPYVELNNNTPDFSEETRRTEPFEEYSELDAYGRCGQAYANICKELMPTEERGAIGMVKPSGWHTIKYDIVDGKYLYNRCHLIGYQLAGENANEKNLITGTRYMNVEGMLPFENEVAEYVKNSNNHVFYRITPIYEEDNLVAAGVEMEAWSVEDEGKGICFDVFVYNNQPGVSIDYATGESWLSKEKSTETQKSEATKTNDIDSTEEEAISEYVLNTNTHKFHRLECDSVQDMKDKNKNTYEGTAKDLIEQGYEPCAKCKP